MNITKPYNNDIFIVEDFLTEQEVIILENLIKKSKKELTETEYNCLLETKMHHWL